MADTTNVDAVNKLSRAKSVIVSKHPFYSAIIFSSKVTMCKSTTINGNKVAIDTGATDGKQFFFNPKYISSLSVQQLLGLLAHEVLHKVFKHVPRMNDRDQRRWNIATDIANNNILLQAGFVLPDDAIINTELKYLSADSIYNLLEDDQTGIKKVGSGRFNYSKHGLDLIDVELTTEDKEAIDNDLKEAIDNFLDTASDSDLTDAENIIDLPETEVEEKSDNWDWKETLRDFFITSSGAECNWRKPNRRLLPTGFYYPVVESNVLDEVVIVLDVSGSIFCLPSLVNTFFTEVNNIILATLPLVVSVVTTDVDVVAHTTLYQGEALDQSLLSKGGGGTDFRKVFSYLKKNCSNARAIVFFTDLDATGIPTNYDTPVIWVDYGVDSKKPSFGTIINIREGNYD